MQRLKVYATSQAGFGHEYEFAAEHLVASVNGSTAVIRLYDGGLLTRVVTYTRVDWIDYTPESGKASKENTQ